MLEMSIWIFIGWVLGFCHSEYRREKLRARAEELERKLKEANHPYGSY